MSRAELIRALADAAEVIKSTIYDDEMDCAADFAAMLGVQASNLSVYLNGKRQEWDGDNEEFLRQASNQMRPVAAYTAEAVWCLRQVDEKKMKREVQL